MGVAFSKVVTDRRLSYDVQMCVLAIQPFVGVPVNVSMGMFSLGEYF